MITCPTSSAILARAGDLEDAYNAVCALDYEPSGFERNVVSRRFQEVAGDATSALDDDVGRLAHDNARHARGAR